MLKQELRKQKEMGTLIALSDDFENAKKLYGDNCRIGKMYIYGKNTGALISYSNIISAEYLRIHNEENSDSDIYFIQMLKKYRFLQIPGKI